MKKSMNHRFDTNHGAPHIDYRMLDDNTDPVIASLSGNALPSPDPFLHPLSAYSEPACRQQSLPVLLYSLLLASSFFLTSSC